MGGSSRSLVQKYNPFEIVVNTNIAGDSGVGNFQLKVFVGSYRYYVDWGDGSPISASTTTTSLTHSYSVPGFYNVKVYGRFDAIYNNFTNEADKITDVISWGNVKWKTFYNSFLGSDNLTGMTSNAPVLELMGNAFSDFGQSFAFTNFDQDLGSWDVSKVINMRWMFNQSGSFNNGGSPSISGWTTSNVNSMEGMFTNTPFNQNIGSWDVSSVQNFAEMFQSCTNFNNGGSPSISGWTTSACTDMHGMFGGSTSVFNQPIGSWDVSNVINMSQMFYLNPTFNQPIGSWDVSNVNNMFEMFISSNFDQDIGSWDVSNVQNMIRIFRSNINFNNGGSPSISGWTINSGFTNMAEMFRFALNFNQPIGPWDVSNVNTMSQMFNSAQSFNQDIGSWDVSNVNNMNQMFNGATNFNNGGSPSISGWTTSACTNMVSMFQFATNFNQPIGLWDVSNVQFMNNMFYGASSFNNNGSPSISGWTTSSCITMSSMFHFSNFNQDIGSWDVSNVTDMSYMFRNAANFNQDIGSWNVSGVTDMTEMFLSSGLDNTNYNALLTGWTGWVGTGATKTLQTNVSFHAGTAKYFTGTTAEAARNYLTDPTTGLSWTITDGGGI